MRIISWNVNSLRSRIYNSNLASKNKKTCSKINSTSPLGKLIKKVKPDIICFAKKAQVGGILAGKRIEEVENNVFIESSRINSTFGGNLVDMIRFKLILEIIEEENLMKNAIEVGAYL